MRQMFDLVSECSDQMAETLSTRALASGKVDCEMKDVFSKYTNDVTICNFHFFFMIDALIR